MVFNYQKKLEQRKIVITNIIAIILFVMLGGIFGLSKNYIYFISGFFILMSPFVFFLIETWRPLDFFYKKIKSYNDRCLLDKSDQRIVSLALNYTNNKAIKGFFSLMDKSNDSNSKFWKSNIDEIEKNLGIKLDELKIGGHVALPAQGSVLLNKAKSVQKYLDN